MTAQADWLDEDLYAVLGVPESASAEEIRAAYRRLARAAHPDANPDDDAAAERFRRITTAHEVLSDPARRRAYDEQQRPGPAAFRGSGGGNGVRIRVNVTDPDDDELLFDELLFDDRFGGPGFGGPGFGGPRFGGSRFGGPRLRDRFGGPRTGGSRSRSPRPRAGGDVTARLRLEFVEAVHGTTTAVSLTGDQVCATCGGRGVVAGDRCGVCAGRGRRRRPRRVEIRIPAGVDDGTTVRLPGRGDPGTDGGPPGDLYVTVEVEPHPEFGRNGDDLTLTVPLTYPEAVLGTTVTVPTLDGDTVTLRVPPGTPPGRVLRVPGRGVPTESGSGDLLLTIDIDVPAHVGDRERELLERLAAARTTNPRQRWGTLA